MMVGNARTLLLPIVPQRAVATEAHVRHSCLHRRGGRKLDAESAYSFAAESVTPS